MLNDICSQQLILEYNSYSLVIGIKPCGEEIPRPPALSVILTEELYPVCCQEPR